MSQQLKCCVKFCNTRGSEGFYKVPIEAERRKLWIELLLLDESKLNTGSRVCRLHFKRSDFGLTNKKLKNGALPSPNLPVSFNNLFINFLAN